MIGIKNIATYLPKQTSSNLDLLNKFEVNEDFILNKIGVKQRTIKESGEKSSDFCVKAYEALLKKVDLEVSKVDCCIVVTQNPDYNIPHTSAIVHKKIGLSVNCACFDISLGCSGYVYGLSNIIAFMKANNFTNGLLFTSDQYSDIIDKDDKNTALIFGDGATVTYIGENANWYPIDFSFGTDGTGYQELICEEKLYMNGRAVFNFTATNVPPNIKDLLTKNNLEDAQIDKYILHQGSKYIIDTIRKRLKVAEEKVVFDMLNYGNLISSSIPMILEKEIDNEKNNTLVISGFGVGLSWGTSILKRLNKTE